MVFFLIFAIPDIPCFSAEMLIRKNTSQYATKNVIRKKCRILTYVKIVPQKRDCFSNKNMFLIILRPACFESKRNGRKSQDTQRFLRITFFLRKKYIAKKICICYNQIKEKAEYMLATCTLPGLSIDG